MAPQPEKEAASNNRQTISSLDERGLSAVLPDEETVGVRQLNQRERTRTGVATKLLWIIAGEIVIAGLLLGLVIVTHSPDGALVKEFLTSVFPLTISAFSGVTAYYFGKEQGRHEQSL